MEVLVVNHITHFVPNTDNIYAKFDEGDGTFSYSKILFFAITEYPVGLEMHSSVEPIVYFQSGEIDSGNEIRNFVGLVPITEVDQKNIF